MTITPTAPGPAVLPAGADSGSATDTAAPGDFLALVQQALAGATAGPQGPAVPGAVTGTPTGTPSGTPNGTPTGTPVDPGASSDTETGTETGTAPGTVPDAAVAAAIAGLVPVIVPVAVAAPVGTPATTPTPTTPASGATASITGPARPAAGASVAPLPAGETRHESTRSDDGDAGTTALPAAADAALPGAQPAGAGDPAPQTQPTAVTAPAPATATAPAAALAAPTVASQDSTTAPVPVAGQVFPEVTSLVSRGNGTHRITMTLNPEALGEVRVVMTVRDGAVHVRLAAGHDARLALLEGSPELTRLLEHAGATDTRIVVRDLPAGPAPTTGSASADQGTDLGQGPGGGLGAGSNRPHDEHAGTRADTPATDGTQHSTTAGANPPPSIQPVTRTRTAGVDVTM